MLVQEKSCECQKAGNLKKNALLYYWMKGRGEGCVGRKNIFPIGAAVRLDSPPIHKNTQIF